MTADRPAADRPAPDPARQLRLARRLARLTSLVLLAWIAFFGYFALFNREDAVPEAAPRLAGLGVAYALVVVSVVLGWRRERLGGRMLIAAAFGVFAVAMAGPGPWTTWSQELIGAALLSLPVLIVGVQLVTTARAAEALAQAAGAADGAGGSSHAHP